MNKSFPLWLRGVLVFAIVIVVLMAVCSPLQYYYGIWGLLATEVILLAITLTAAVACKIPIKEMLPAKAPRLGQIIGVVVMCAAGIVFAACSNFIMFFFFPQSMQLVDEFSNLYKSAPGVVTWLIIALSPAVCEETLHRGFILYTFKNSGFRSKWFIVIWMGLIFGAFHMDPIRFAATCILGMILTYVALESGNILLPVIYHMLNNSLSVIAGLTFSTDESLSMSQVLSSSIMPSLIGTMFIMSAIALYLLRLGARMVGARKPALSTLSPDPDYERIRASHRKTLYITVFASIILFVAGIFLIYQTMLNTPPLFDEILTM